MYSGYFMKYRLWECIITHIESEYMNICWHQITPLLLSKIRLISLEKWCILVQPTRARELLSSGAVLVSSTTVRDATGRMLTQPSPPRSPPTFPSQTSPIRARMKWPWGHHKTEVGPAWCHPLTSSCSLPCAQPVPMPPCLNPRTDEQIHWLVFTPVKPCWQLFPVCSVKDVPWRLWEVSQQTLISSWYGGEHAQTALHPLQYGCQAWGTWGRAQGLSEDSWGALHHWASVAGRVKKVAVSSGPSGAPTTPAVLPASWTWTEMNLSSIFNSANVRSPTSSRVGVHS